MMLLKKITIKLLKSKMGILISDKTFLKILYFCKINKRANLDNPRRFNEKLQWLKLFDRKGNLVDSWTSTEEEYKISGLIPNDIYEIVEELAPEGYVKLSTSIKFRINDEGKVETLKCTITDSDIQRLVELLLVM